MMNAAKKPAGLLSVLALTVCSAENVFSPGFEGSGQSGCAPVESEHFPDFGISPALKNISEFRITVHPGESFVICDGRWHDLADEATAELFGKDYPIGNAGIKALLEA